MNRLHYMPSDVHVLTSLEDRRKAIELRGRIYADLFPRVAEPGKPDIYDFNSILWVAKNSGGATVATARLAHDDPECGLPSERYVAGYLKSLRKRKAKLAEYGRFVNIEAGQAKKDLTKAFYGRVYFHACCHEIDTILIVAPIAKESLYVDCFGASVLCADIGEDYGSGTPFAAFTWDVRSIKPDFFTWIFGKCNSKRV